MQRLKAFLLITGLFLGCSAAFAFKPELGEPPASLAEHLEYVDGTQLDLVALKGKPVVLYFGADWCVPCQVHGRPATIAVAQKYAAQGVEVIFVSMDDNTKRDTRKSEATAMPYMKIAMPRLAICPPGKCLEGLRDLGAFGRIWGYPSAFVLDKDGVLASRLRSGTSIRDGLEKSVRAVLK